MTATASGSLAAGIQVKLTEGEHARLRYTTTHNFEAWTYWVQGLSPKSRMSSHKTG
jgi:hypothetical protein